ncbi:MAG: toxic anion resistance protein [Clostridia bacterium]|nr:toxic anion resistance protein [Clostridia bacterium]
MQNQDGITSLTLSPDLTAEPAEAVRAPEAEQIEEPNPLTEAEMEQARLFSEKIDITNMAQIMSYGAAAQRKMADFSEGALETVRTKDLGEVGAMITDLVGELRGFDADEKEKGLFGRLKRGVNKIAALKTKYDKAEVNVERICNMLEDHQVVLMKDVALLDQMYEKNLLNYKELTMYIYAGKERLKHERAVTLKELMDKAQASGTPEDAQAANDFAALCDRFEKKLHDLELTRMVSIQMSPQIRLVQNNDTLMAEKIQSTLVNTVPLWKSQMVLALGVAHSEEAMQAQRAVSDMTNELLKKNAEKLKMATVETARESERGVVDIETLAQTNGMLIETLNDVMTIQKEGAAKRRAAEQELHRMEGELKAKLLELNR